MPDFLLELLSEEIPARMQGKAEADLARLFAEQLAAAGLKAEGIETFSTPRRLALIARGLPSETTAVSEEIKGPRASAPPQALEGFLRKTGLAREQLVERDGILFAVIDKPGRATAAVLAEAVPAMVRAFPWPKSMRWGAASLDTASLRWVRPLQGIVALLGEEIVDFEIGDVRGASPAKVEAGFASGDATTIKSGAATVGHRFHHPGVITIGGAHDYAEKLRACHVIVDAAERRRIIAEGAHAAARAAGLTMIEDEGLLHENAGLTEWPVPLLGSFDPAFLDVPREVIQLTMRTNQKYFALSDGEGRLAPHFICTANIEASDGGAAIVAGNRKVLAARLSDAKFFWEHDLKIPLDQQAGKLSQIVFHEKLGTVADKVERVARLARWLVEEGIVAGTVTPAKAGVQAGAEQGEGSAGMPASAGAAKADLANQAETAARLAKADLVTGMVGEFPELQGIIGGYLARAQGHPDAVADAIRDHYKPVGQGDEVPTAPVTVAVSLADKLDSLGAFFAIGEQPTGSRDPFALRRSALGTIRLLVENGLRLSLNTVRPELVEGLSFLNPEGNEGASTGSARAVWWDQLLDFFADRLKVQQREAGVRHDLIDAVFALGGEDDLVRLLARVRALQAFVETPEGADLLAGYKRAANILKKEGWVASTSSRHPGLDPGSTLSSPTDVAEGRSMPDQVRHDDDEGTGIMSGPEEQGIPQTGEEDPLVLVEEPTIAEAVAEMAHHVPHGLSYTPEKEEADLIAALESAQPRAAAAVEAEDFAGAMAALASLRAPVDSFFDRVTVNDPDPAKREARLALLARMRDAVDRVADFSRIEG